MIEALCDGWPESLVICQRKGHIFSKLAQCAAGFNKIIKFRVWKPIQGIRKKMNNKSIDLFQHDAILKVCAVHHQ